MTGLLGSFHEVLYDFKCIVYFFLCQIQDIRYYVELLGLFRVVLLRVEYYSEVRKHNHEIHI